MEASTAASALSTLAPAVQNTPSLTPSHTFIKLCLLWTALHRNSHFPEGCKGVLTEKTVQRFQNSEDLSSIISGFYDNGRRIHKVLPDQEDKRKRVYSNEHPAGYHYKYTTRSLSVIGVLGGIVLILLVVALSTCIRNRRGLAMDPYSVSTGHESFARQILIDHIRHIRQTRRERNATAHSDTPPAYEDVVKDTDEEENAAKDTEEEEAQPPTYVEAMESSLRLEALEAEESTSPDLQPNSHVVQIEVAYPPSNPQREIEVQS